VAAALGEGMGPRVLAAWASPAQPDPRGHCGGQIESGPCSWPGLL